MGGRTIACPFHSCGCCKLLLSSQDVFHKDRMINTTTNILTFTKEWGIFKYWLRLHHHPTFLHHNIISDLKNICSVFIWWKVYSSQVILSMKKKTCIHDKLANKMCITSPIYKLVGLVNPEDMKLANHRWKNSWEGWISEVTRLNTVDIESLPTLSLSSKTTMFTIQRMTWDP